MIKTKFEIKTQFKINKTRKKANDINKKMIIKAYKLCSAQELDLSKCDSIPKLISNGYLDEFNDPYNSKENEINNAYTLIVKDDIAKVIYNGDGVQQVYEIPPTQYFSWCNEDNGKHSCADGLSNEGKSWLQKHDDILTFPDTIKTIKKYNIPLRIITVLSDNNYDEIPKLAKTIHEELGLGFRLLPNIIEYGKGVTANDEYGVCTDVVAFALKDAGYDLQSLVNEHILANKDLLDKKCP